jgi:hypothetical protein
MIAEAKHLAKDEKKNRFLEMADSWNLQANKIAMVKKDKADRKSVAYLERQEANLMIVMADTLRRCVVAQNTGKQVESSMLLQVEQMAAIATAVGARRLQRGSS